MPTLARSRRAASLRAALLSVLSQQGVRAVPIVVVNGAERDPDIIAELSRRTDLRLTLLPKPDLPGALRAGRALVDTPWFAELDDDDLLLPGALRRRLDCLRDGSDADADVVVSNGIVRNGATDHLLLDDTAGIGREPLAALARLNWLAPGGALFRTAAVPVPMFEALPRFLEWTTLAVRLATACRLKFLDEPTFVHHENTPDSLWHSPACTLGLPEAMRLLLREQMPPALRQRVRERLAGACHAAARVELHGGRADRAWRLHLQSLAARGGWRYLAFTGPLLAAGWRTRRLPG
jgi:hypothetical protein